MEAGGAEEEGCAAGDGGRFESWGGRSGPSRGVGCCCPASGGGAFPRAGFQGWGLWVSPALPARLCLSLQDLLGLLLLFSLAANVAQRAEVRGLRSPGGHERGSVSEDGCGGVQAPLLRLMSLSGRPTARRTPGSRSWSLCGA